MVYPELKDASNWGLFGLYTLFVWTLALVLVPGLIYLLSWAATKFSGIKHSINDVFLASTGALLPLGLMLWIAFVIPMLFVNVTFILQSMSDPFGWGWDFFGTANIPWHQFVPSLVPWLQSLLILIGLGYSLRNLKKTWSNENLSAKKLFFDYVADGCTDYYSGSCYDIFPYELEKNQKFIKFDSNAFLTKQ